MDDLAGLHRTLARQLRRLGLSPAGAPPIEAWNRLLERVNASYLEADADRYPLERSIAISSEEMRLLYDGLNFQARHDVLTALPNQLALKELLSDAIAAEAGGKESGILFIDLDGIDQVTDRVGRSAGDELLVLASQRIRGALDDQDILARLGGDQFVVLRQLVIRSRR